MAKIVAISTVSPAKRAQFFYGDFTPGDNVSIERVVEGVPAGRSIKDGWLTFKNVQADADPGVLQLVIGTILNAQGHVSDTGLDGVGYVKFTPTVAQTLLLTGTTYYDIQVGLDNGDTYTVEIGRHRGWLPQVDAWQGERRSRGLVRRVSVEPLEHQPWRYENDLADDFVAGDDYTIERTIDGLQGSETVTSARLTALETSAQADPGLFQIAITTTASASGQIVDAGSGVPRTARVQFKFTRAQTALLNIARGWRMQLTLSDGMRYTVLRGTLYASLGVTAAAGTPSAGPALVHTFTGAEDLTTPGPADTGQAVVMHMGVWGRTAGQRCRYVSGGASNLNTVSWSSGLADGYVQLRWAAGTADDSLRLVFRCTDHNNHLFINGTGTVWKMVAGALTSIGSVATPAIPSLMRVEMAAGNLTVKDDGVTVGTFTDSFNATAVRYGCGNGNFATTGEYDDLEMGA